MEPHRAGGTRIGREDMTPYDAPGEDAVPHCAGHLRDNRGSGCTRGAPRHAGAPLCELGDAAALLRVTAAIRVFASPRSYRCR